MKHGRLMGLFAAIGLAVTFIAPLVAADGWLERWAHHNGSFGGGYLYHVHAYVGAEFYASGGNCPYKNWLHGANDTSAEDPLTWTMEEEDSPTNGSTQTFIWAGSYEVDSEYVELTELEYCPS